MKNFTFFILSTIFFLGATFSTAAQTTNWTGNVSNDWADPGNWSNGVPGPNMTANFVWFSSSNSTPTISANTNFKKLQMADQGQPFEVKINDGVVVNVEELSMGFTGSPSNFSLNIGNGTINVTGSSDVIFGGQLLIDNGTINTSGNFKLASNGIINSQSGTLNVGSVFSIIGSATAHFHQSNLTADGFSIGGSGSLDAGNALFEFYGDMEFSGDQIFIIVGTSTVILNGNVEITQSGNNREANFYNLIVSENANVVSHIDIIVDNNMYNYGSYEQVNNSNLNVINELQGSENITSPFPYLITLEIMDSHTLKATFNQELTVISAERAANYEIRNGIESNAMVIDPISANPVLQGPGNNVVVITTDNPIVEMENWVLWIKGHETHYYGSPNDSNGVRNMNGKSVTDPYHKKRFVKDFVVWTGAVSSNWNDPGNWEYNGMGSFPSPGANFNLRYAASVAHELVLTTPVIVNNIDNSTFENMDLGGQTLRITGTINMSGTGKIVANGEGATVLFQGSEEQLIPEGIFEANSVYNLTIDNSGAGVKLEGNLNMFGTLDLTNGELDLNNHVLTFKCSGEKSAILAPVTGGSILGEVTVERCIPPLRAFRFVSPAVTTTTSIHDNWQEGATSYTDNPNPGYGTHITGVGTSPDQTNGFDFTPSGNPSLYLFDNQTQVWNPIANTDQLPLVAGSSYRLMVRGDRSVDVTDNDTEPTFTILRATGTLSVGNKTVPVNQTPGAYNFVGNPYQAVVDMNDVMDNSTNLNPNYYYIWDPHTGTRGSYVTVDLSMGTTNLTNSAANQFLQPGQAFFVSTAAPGSASVFFEESDKAVEGDFTNVFKPAISTASIKMQLSDSQSFFDEGNVVDGFLVTFSEGESNEVLLNDASKLGNLDENLCSVNGTDYLSIEKRALPLDGETIPLFINQYRANNYTFQIETAHFESNVTPYLHDAYLNIATELANGTTLVDFEIDAAIPASIAPDRFSISFEVDELSVEEQEMHVLSVYPNPAVQGYFFVSIPRTAGGEAEISLYNMLGQQVYFSKEQIGMDDQAKVKTDSLAPGAYIVEVNQGGKTFTGKIIIQ